MAMTFGSLFAGIGGFDLGLERAGMVCKFQVEIDDYARRVLEKHWPDVKRYRDVTKFCRRIYDCDPEDEEGNVWCPRCRMEFGECECVGTDQLLDECGQVDVLCGGDPCQENSNARRGEGLKSQSLGHEFVRVIAEIRPRIVLRENPSVVRADAPWPWWRFRDALESLGYAVLPFRVRSCCVGADFRRDRLFLLASLQDTHSQGLEGNVCKLLENSKKRRQDANASRSDRWSSSPRICGGSDGIPKRMDRLKCLGNAVVPQVAEFIGNLIIKSSESYNNMP